MKINSPELAHARLTPRIFRLDLNAAISIIPDNDETDAVPGSYTIPSSMMKITKDFVDTTSLSIVIKSCQKKGFHPYGFAVCICNHF